MDHESWREAAVAVGTRRGCREFKYVMEKN
jgi:hypothetical protein